jgi:hypothetical protein
MFDPISARFASSFSRNGISEAATETSCFGETSMNCTLSRGEDEVAGLARVDAVVRERPFSSSSALACAMMYWSSSHADR